MAASAILAKGSHEGMLILDGTNRETVEAVEVFRADRSVVMEEQFVGEVGGVSRCR